MLKSLWNNIDILIASGVMLLAMLLIWLGSASYEFNLLANGLVLIVLILLVSFRKLSSEQKRQRELIDQTLENQKVDFKEIEALISLYSTQQFSLPLPVMRGSAVSPDFANTIISEIFKNKPQKIVECGSGVSTIVAAKCLKKIGQGHIFSLDHEKEYAEITNGNLKLHELESYVTIVYAPLKEITINSIEWLWYETKFLDNLSKVDMLIIDGPTRNRKKKMVRYPALPLLIKHLNDKAVIILDDASREDERNVVSAWLKEFNGLVAEYFTTEKGTVIIRKKSDSEDSF